jgi:hypothetical protein
MDVFTEKTASSVLAEILFLTPQKSWKRVHTILILKYDVTVLRDDWITQHFTHCCNSAPTSGSETTCTSKLQPFQGFRTDDNTKSYATCYIVPAFHVSLVGLRLLNDAVSTGEIYSAHC